jgi:hypothetical protein
VAVARLDADAHLDAATLDGAGDVLLLAGNGDGTLRAPRLLGNVGAEPLGRFDRPARRLVAADFDGDGRSDLAVGRGVGPGFVLLRARADGTFVRSEPRPEAPPFDALAAADLDRDGHLDLVASERMGHGWVLLGRGDGSFADGQDLGTRSWLAEVADLTGDGVPDVVFQSCTVRPGTGDGNFGAPLPQPHHQRCDWTWTGDFNGDGRLDLSGTGHLSQGMNEAFTFYELAGPLAPAAARPEIPYGSGPKAGWAGDFNGDGVDDAVFFDGLVYENAWSNALFLALSGRTVGKQRDTAGSALPSP